MANVKKSTPRKVSTKRKQGHKLIWFTVIVIAIPVIFVAYVLLTSAVGQDKPVIGNRFGSNDLNPKITQDNLDQIQSALTSIDGVQNAEVTLKSATLRISVDCADDAGQDTVQSIADQSYDAVAGVLPIETYFMNPQDKDGKNYDLEVGAYNFIPKDGNTDGFVYIKEIKTGNGEKTTDVETSAKNQNVVNAITR